MSAYPRLMTDENEDLITVTPYAVPDAQVYLEIKEFVGLDKNDEAVYQHSVAVLPARRARKLAKYLIKAANDAEGLE